MRRSASKAKEKPALRSETNWPGRLSPNREICPLLTIAEACQTLRQGGIVAHPTEAIWGLACCSQEPHAIERLVQFKKKHGEGFLLIGDTWECLEPWMEAWSQAMQDKAKQLWMESDEDQAYSLIGPAPSWGSPQICAKDRSIGLRLTRHPLSAQLCAEAGYPLVSTSANAPEEPPALSQEEMSLPVQNMADGAVLGELGHASRPSAIFDLRTRQWIRR